jgi:hypothetical protein
MRHALTTFVAATTAFAAQAAHAHPGHAMAAASHWHASDTVSLLVVGLIVSAACWFTRAK